MTSTRLKDYFTRGKWKGGGAETVSGKGSTLHYTEALRPRASLQQPERRKEGHTQPGASQPKQRGGGHCAAFFRSL